jgi:hypothetical protein
MGNRTKANSSLEALIAMALPLLKEAERQCPRTGPGAKPTIPDWFIGLLIMVAVLKRKKDKAAQLRFSQDEAHRRLIHRITGEDCFPSRSTFYRRYRRAHVLFSKAIELQAQAAIEEEVTDPQEAAVDKSLIAARGRPWHTQDQRKGKCPRGVDREAAWGQSEYHGWVYGYSFEVVVASTRKTTVFPLLASVGTASAAEVRTFAEKIDRLHPAVRSVSADSGYDANILGERIEWDERGRPTRRHFLCPQNPRNTANRKLKPCTSSNEARRRELRQQRKGYLKSARGQRAYQRRSRTVEPFNSWLKSLFELDTRVWHRGLANNQTQILAAIFAYQLLVRYNHRRGNHNGRLRWLIDTL